jgi:hypothetical protein
MVVREVVIILLILVMVVITSRAPWSKLAIFFKNIELYTIEGSKCLVCFEILKAFLS